MHPVTPNKVGGISEERHWLRLTRYCNQRCLFCLDRDFQDGGDVAFEDIRRELSAARARGLRRVVLSGGEPTVHPRFLDVVALARRLGYAHIQVISNGQRFCYPDFLRRAVRAGLGEVTLSLHGHAPALHDRLTRVPGSFVRAIAAMRNVLAVPGLILSVDVVINRLNLPRLRELLDFYVRAGVREFDLLALVPFGDGWKNHEELYCDFSKTRNLAHLRRALELSARRDLHIWTNRLRPEFLEGFERLIQSPDKIFDELRGRRRVLARYIEGGERPPCFGDPCRYCFMDDFCRDLDALLKDGSLPARVGPLCLGGAGEIPAFRLGRKRSIEDFARFYISSRHFAKGSACRGCALASRCDGISVGRVRRESFAVLKRRRSGA